jgi:hypothetical protein
VWEFFVKIAMELLEERGNQRFYPAKVNSGIKFWMHCQAAEAALMTSYRGLEAVPFQAIQRMQGAT